MKLKLALTLFLSLGCMAPAMVQAMETESVVTVQQEKAQTEASEKPSTYSFTKTQIMGACVAVGLVAVGCYYWGKHSAPTPLSRLVLVQAAPSETGLDQWQKEHLYGLLTELERSSGCTTPLWMKKIRETITSW